MGNSIVNIVPPLSEAMLDELKSKIFYASDMIKSFNILSKNGKIFGVQLELFENAVEEEVKKKVNSVIEKNISNRKSISEQTVWTNEKEVNFHTEIFEELKNKGIVFEAGEGQVALGELFIKLMNYIDKQILQMVKQKFNAQEYQYPTLIKTDVIKRCGYFDSFPHFLMFVTRLHNDAEVYESFNHKCGCGNHLESNNILLDFCKNADYCLPPTMCYHTYHQYADKIFAAAPNFTITSKGKSFRYESKYHHSLERLWDFTIREIVFLGDLDYVTMARRSMMEIIFEFISNLGLCGKCTTASDPFFYDENAENKIIFQKALKSKYEMRLNVSESKTIAVGSFNFHDSFFGKNFNIKFEKENYLKTACVGFGLERFAYAFLCQYGADKTQWPEMVKRELED